MATDTTVNNLIINKLTKAQYEAIASPSDTELYLVPDEIDNVPTSGSDNPVKSGGVYTALTDKADKSEMSVSTSSDQTTITLKSGTSATVINSHQSLSGKQDTLVSGTNIKTINNQSLLGEGNITIQGGGGSGVQSDWNETDTSSAAYILNKPSMISSQFSYDSTNEGLVISPASATSYNSSTETLTIL